MTGRRSGRHSGRGWRPSVGLEQAVALTLMAGLALVLGVAHRGAARRVRSAIVALTTSLALAAMVAVVFLTGPASRRPSFYPAPITIGPPRTAALSQPASHPPVPDRMQKVH